MGDRVGDGVGDGVDDEVGVDPKKTGCVETSWGKYGTVQKAEGHFSCRDTQNIWTLMPNHRGHN